jgi:hypothetical protein
MLVAENPTQDALGDYPGTLARIVAIGERDEGLGLVNRPSTKFEVYIDRGTYPVEA